MEIIDRFGLDLDMRRELVSLAYQFYDRFIDNLHRQQQQQQNYTSDQARCIALSVLLVAIKAKLPTEQVGIATEIAMSECIRNALDPMELVRIETEVLQTLEWRVHPPLMHEFARLFSLLHPLAVSGDDFNTTALLNTTLSLFDRAVTIPDLMTSYKASEIAVAAMLVAGNYLDDQVVTEEMREEFEDLMYEIGFNDVNVLHASFIFENMDNEEEHEQQPVQIVAVRPEAAHHIVGQRDNNGDNDWQASPSSVASH
jgi:hypothetical protein